MDLTYTPEQQAFRKEARTWLQANVPEPEVRRCVLTMVTVIYCEYPERASVGRLMGFLAPRDDLPELLTAYPDHPEVGGMQGLMLPWARAIEERGGRIVLGLDPLSHLLWSLGQLGVVDLAPDSDGRPVQGRSAGKDPGHRVIVGVQNRVELVIVTACTTERQPEECFADLADL